MASGLVWVQSSRIYRALSPRWGALSSKTRSFIRAILDPQRHGLHFQMWWDIEKWNQAPPGVPSWGLRQNAWWFGTPIIDHFGPNSVPDVGEVVALKLIVGATATAYNNANAFIGIGDSSTAFAEGQTGLQAASNKTFVAMNATYPTTPATVSGTTTVQFQSDFGAANYVWAEACISNGNNPPTSGIMLDRLVSAMGTKASGTWTPTTTFEAL